MQCGQGSDLIFVFAFFAGVFCELKVIIVGYGLMLLQTCGTHPLLAPAVTFDDRLSAPDGE